LKDNWRVLDTGLRPAAQNVALSRALLEGRRADESPGTLRFLRYTSSALLAARHSAEQQFDLDYCRARGITVQRRISGGPAFYTDEAQLGWELHLHARDAGECSAQAITRRLCHAAATAISALGVDARFRAGGDIEVDGRRIAASGMVTDRGVVLFQATLAVDCDFPTVLRVLRFSAGKPPASALSSVQERETSLKILLGKAPGTALVKRYLAEAYESEFGVEFAEGDITLSEHARYQKSLPEIDASDWVNFIARPASEMPIAEAVQPYSGGLLRASLMWEAGTQTIRQVWFTGDIAANPPRALPDLEAALRDTPISRLARKMEWFFRSRAIEIPGLGPEDFIGLVRRAAGRPLLARNN
jgi:lipoate-protein ligase A